MNDPEVAMPPSRRRLTAPVAVAVAVLCPGRCHLSLSLLLINAASRSSSHEIPDEPNVETFKFQAELPWGQRPA
jgi:hypothetical protein